MRLHEERGMAMIVSMMVAFVVLMLSTIVVAQSIHSLDSSGYDRKRLLSINAAEAGTNHWYQYLQTTPIISLDCSDKAEVVSSGPAVASFEASATFYDADAATVMDCSTFSDTTFPSYVAIRSTGTINGNTPRAIETFVRLTPNYGGFGAAIMAANPTSFVNSFEIYGNTGNDGDVYILSGDLVINNTPNIRGNVYVPQGSASTFNNNTIWGNLWARDDIEINNPATVKGAALSELGDISGTGAIEGSATALGDIDAAGTLTIGGTVSPYTEVPVTPTQTFPQVGYVSSDWTNAGYTEHIYTGATACTSAKTFIASGWTGNHVVRITGATACTLTYSGAATNISLNGSLAIITDWGVNLANNNNWNGTAGTKKQLHFISTWPAASCPAGATNKNIVVGNSTSFNTQVEVLFYTPCTATMNNQNNFAGQLMASNVNIANNFEMTYKPVLVPGITGITGFKQDISYVHESSA